MADTDVFKKCVLNQHGGMVGFITEYEAGRPKGDHHVKVLTNQAAKDAGEGDILDLWTVVGDEPGAIKIL